MSKQSLTGLYFDATITNDDADLCMPPKLFVLPEQQNNADQKFTVAKINVLQTKNNSLLYAEGDAGFIDVIFGLLCIPLGSIIKSFGQWPDGSGNGCVRPECQSLLLFPKVAPFGCGASKVLEVEEITPTLDVNCWFKCLKGYGFAGSGRCHQQYYCGDKVKNTKLCELNPKAPKGGNRNSETYVKGGHMKFMVTDDLHVLPLSLSTTLQVLCNANVHTEELEDREIALRKFEVCNFLNLAIYIALGHWLIR